MCLTIFLIFQLVKERTVLPETLHLFLDASEHSRLLVEKYLNLTRPLYFDYTHLVCRTAVDGKFQISQWMFNSFNCQSCQKEAALVQNDFHKMHLYHLNTKETILLVCDRTKNDLKFETDRCTFQILNFSMADAIGPKMI
jgi:hypothetical protein